MTPNSFAYIVFLVIGALIYHPLSQKAKKPFLLLLNFMFYAIGGVKFLPLLALTVAFNFFAAQKLERTERKRGLLTLVLVLNLGALGLFKYLGFFGELLGCTGVQPVSYTHLDVYKRQSLRRLRSRCRGALRKFCAFVQLCGLAYLSDGKRGFFFCPLKIP